MLLRRVSPIALRLVSPPGVWPKGTAECDDRCFTYSQGEPEPAVLAEHTFWDSLSLISLGISCRPFRKYLNLPGQDSRQSLFLTVITVFRIHLWTRELITSVSAVLGSQLMRLVFISFGQVSGVGSPCLTWDVFRVRISIWNSHPYHQMGWIGTCGV